MLTLIKLLLYIVRPKAVPEDYYEKEFRAIKKEQKQERISEQISQLINSTASLLSEEKPYPTYVFQRVDELRVLINSINKHKEKKYFSHCVELSKEWIFNNDPPILEPVLLAYREELFNSFSQNGGLDLDNIQIILLDKYFLDFTDYWEKAISALKKRSAIVNRRKYLIGLTQELNDLLLQRSITKYEALLIDYRDFNISELNALQK